MHFFAYYCIHCQRHFIGKFAQPAIRRHIRSAHGKQAICSPRGNIRHCYIEVQEYSDSNGSLYFPDWDGSLKIEVANTPPDVEDAVP